VMIFIFAVQAFNWESCKQRWWTLLASRVDELANWGFTSLWLPPAWDSLAPQGQIMTCTSTKPLLFSHVCFADVWSVMDKPRLPTPRLVLLEYSIWKRR
jgi:hypothetical protein